MVPVSPPTRGPYRLKTPGLKLVWDIYALHSVSQWRVPPNSVCCLCRSLPLIFHTFGMAAEMSSHYPELSGNKEKVSCDYTTSFILLLALQSAEDNGLPLPKPPWPEITQNSCHSGSMQSFEKRAQEGSPHQLPTKSSDDNVYAMSEERHRHIQTCFLAS